DGTAYLDQMAPQEALVYRWIRDNIHGVPTLLEAQGDGYQGFSRAAMQTGLPVVLGWSYHVNQRGTPPGETERRASDIVKIYNSPDVLTTVRLLEKYKVKLILVGKLEKEKYNQAGIQKFGLHSQFFPLIFESGDMAIYATSGGLNRSRQGQSIEIGW